MPQWEHQWLCSVQSIVGPIQFTGNRCWTTPRVRQVLDKLKASCCAKLHGILVLPLPASISCSENVNFTTDGKSVQFMFHHKIQYNALYWDNEGRLPAISHQHMHACMHAGASLCLISIGKLICTCMHTRRDGFLIF